MNTFKNTAVRFFMILAMVAGSALVSAETLAPSSGESVNSTIEHIEKALVEIKKSDFSAANLHLKAARASAELIAGNETVVKEAKSLLIQGMVESKKGNIATSTVQLSKGLELYKTL